MKLSTQPPTQQISKPIFFLCILLLLIFSIFLLKQFHKKESDSKESSFIMEKMTVSSKPIRLIREKDGFVIDLKKSSISYCYPNQQCKKKVYPLPYLKTLLSPQLKKTKPEISDLLRMYGIPVPRYVILNRLNAGKTFPQNYPIVLKPLGQFQKYHEIYTDIDNYTEYTQTRDELLKRYERVMMENQIEGESYRIYLFAGDVMDIIQRIRPFVTGDGKHTVRQLIELRNKMRVAEKKHPTQIVSEKLIDQQGYSMNSILTKGHSIQITTAIHYQNGADSKHLSVQQIPKENIALFKKAVQIVGFECAGIDFISPDITKSYQTPPIDQVFIQDSVYQADRSFGTIITIHNMIEKHTMMNEKK
jgi:hypothetical protein